MFSPIVLSAATVWCNLVARNLVEVNAVALDHGVSDSAKAVHGEGRELEGLNGACNQNGEKKRVTR